MDTTTLPVQPVGQGQFCCDETWEAAYKRFETPAEEIRKFHKRYQRLNCDRWSRDWEVVELFCGRGNGMVALEQLGFHRLEGVDLSGTLLAEYGGPAKTYVADCRQLPFADQSRDLMVVQGGLHHLPVIPEDLETVLQEVRRTLRPQGKFVVVEPWRTPFLRLVHFACGFSWLRRAWPKLDALHVMTLHELTTYEQWLGAPQPILHLFQKYFDVQICRIGWGKLMFVGSPKA